MTDTSYFPTDDLGELCLVTFTKGPVFTIILGNVPDALPKDAGVGAEKDLAFLGYVGDCSAQRVLRMLTCGV